MKIKASLFYDFPQKGAIRIEINKIELDVIDSIFSSCNNAQSGGAIRVAITEGNCRFNRDCGTDCYTTTADNGNDFGQFICVSCTKGQNVFENLAASFCPGYKTASVQNGALGFLGRANLLCSHSNSSNNYGHFGPGFAARQATNVALSYMNFANDTACTTERKDYWIAAVFHDNSQGSVSMSNFVNCKSKITSGSTPVGTFSRCIFADCENYFISKLASGNTNGSPSIFPFPKKCDAKIAQDIDDIYKVDRGILILGLSLLSTKYFS